MASRFNVLAIRMDPSGMTRDDEPIADVPRDRRTAGV
jgi:hypothetical protein